MRLANQSMYLDMPIAFAFHCVWKHYHKTNLMLFARNYNSIAKRTTSQHQTKSVLYSKFHRGGVILPIFQKWYV